MRHCVTAGSLTICDGDAVGIKSVLKSARVLFEITFSHLTGSLLCCARGHMLTVEPTPGVVYRKDDADGSVMLREIG